MSQPLKIASGPTFHDKLESAGRRPSGFDFLRMALSIGIVAIHGILICGGSAGVDWVFGGAIRPFAYFLVPSFFALSGFLIAGSLERNTLPGFFTARALRIVPALAVEVFLSAVVIGALFTNLPWADYFTSGGFWAYFLNMLGWVHYRLPGVFPDVPFGNNVNGQLWTIPFELECYVALGGLMALGIVRRARLLLLVVTLLILALTAYQLLSVTGHPRAGLPPGRLLVSCFLLGVWMYVARDKIPFSWPLFVASVLACWKMLDTVDLMYLAALPICYVTAFLGLQNPRRIPVLDGGDYSYGIYLYSFPLQQVLAELFPEHRHWLFNATVGLVLAWMCAYLSWHFVEVKALSLRKVAVAHVTEAVTRLGMVRPPPPAGAPRHDLVFGRSLFWPWWRGWISRIH